MQYNVVKQNIAKLLTEIWSVCITFMSYGMLGLCYCTLRSVSVNCHWTRSCQIFS